MAKQARAHELFRPLIVLSIVAALMLFMGGLTMAYSMDKAAKEREQVLIANGLKAGILDLRKDIKIIASWDQALQHLERNDRQWAAEYVGRYFHEMAGFNYAFVLDHRNRLFFAAHEGVPQAADIYRPFTASMQRAIDMVRSRERQDDRRDLPANALRQPLAEHNIVKADGHVYVAIVTLVQSDFRRMQQIHDRAPIIIALHRVDGAFLKRIGIRYLEPGLSVRQVRMPGSSDLAQVDLHDDQGRYVATLEWAPGTPGTWLAARLAAHALGIIILFFLVTRTLHRRSWRAAQALIASEARASHMAYHDPLTGLPNRVMFFERLGVALDQVRRNATTVAVHCIDLDRFKEVNDTFGHQMGDELIRTVAHRISEICRRSDTFARLSGDEFAIVQLHASPMGAARLAQRIVETLAQPMNL